MRLRPPRRRQPAQRLRDLPRLGRLPGDGQHQGRPHHVQHERGGVRARGPLFGPRGVRLRKQGPQASLKGVAKQDATTEIDAPYVQ